MDTYDVSEEDKNLIEAARLYVAEHFVADQHFVGSAGRTTDGTVLTGINLAGSPRGIDVCGEPTVLAQTVVKRYGKLETIVAVRYNADGTSYVVAPCGKCREMISRYSPDALVIVPDKTGTLRKVSTEELLPFKYRKTEI